MSYKVSPKRHIAKTISYRLVSTGVGFLIMWWATGNIAFGAAFGAAELVLKPIIYYLHERAWYKWTKFGLIDIVEKKKKNSGLTEGKIKSQIKIYDEELPTTQAPPPPVPPSSSGKKVLSYSSNR
jgi:uncharacterized membrane protein